MNIDILVNSCARPDLLHESIYSFKKHLKTNNHSFRWVIIEDRVDNKLRQLKGKQWIENNSHIFDKIIFLEKKAGPGYWWAKTIEQCKTSIHIHLEDDCKFITDINIDPIIEVMINNSNIVEVIFRRDTSKKKGGNYKIEGLPLFEMELMSVATGIFNTNNVISIIDKLGWNNQLHESLTLTPTSQKLLLRKFVLDHNKIHYIHTGQKKCYRKGKWVEK